MSLEQELAANTAALKALTAALAANPMKAPTSAPSTAAVAPVPTAPVESLASSPLPTAAFAPPAAIVPLPVMTAAPPTAPPAVSGERDSKGMPWDGRIHASSKAKVADGSWRYKRGTGDTYIIQIEGELRNALSAPAPATGGPVFAPHPFYDTTAPASVVAPPPPAAPAVPVAPVAAAAPAPVVAPPPAASVAVPVAPVTGVVAPPPAASVAVPVAPAAGTTGITTYDTLMAALPPKIVSGELTAAQMQEACESYGVPSIAALATRPDLVPFIAAALRL